MAKKILINIDGCGFGNDAGMSRAETRLKNKPNGTIAVCIFDNGHATFIKYRGKIRPITQTEIKRYNRKQNES